MFISLFSCFLMLLCITFRYMRLRVRKLSVFSLAVTLMHRTGISVGIGKAEYCTCRSVLHHHLSLFRLLYVVLASKRLSQFYSAIAAHVSSSDTLEHDRKQAHAFSKRVAGCNVFFSSFLFSTKSLPNSQALLHGVVFVFCFLAVFLNSSLTERKSILLLHILLVDMRRFNLNFGC